jgi:hypothetical protein
MRSKSTSWRWTLWIACFAMLMNALAPSISHAMAASQNVPATWEICSVDSPPVAKHMTTHQADAMADCGYCLPHGGSFALMPSTISGLGLMGGHALRPFLFYRAPQPLLALTAAPPRGPPLAS